MTETPTTPTEPDPDTDADGPTVPEPELVTVDIRNPAAVMAALGYPTTKARAVVITPGGMLPISADYPPTPFDAPATTPAPPPTETEEV